MRNEDEGRGSGQQQDDARDERNERMCGALGDLIAGLPETPAPIPDVRLGARLERALAEDPRSPDAADRARRRWLRLVPALAGALAVAAAVTFWVARIRPLTYEVEGDAVDRAGHVAAESGGPATIRFSDGTAIGLSPSATGWIAARTRVGATFAIEHGKASFAIVHRPGARWLVQAGPFQIVVTGTRFDVRWSGERGDLQLDLRQGGVTVRGGVAGDGVSLRAGQRLLASASRNQLTVEEVPAPAKTAAPAADAPETAGADEASEAHPSAAATAIVRRPPPAAAVTEPRAAPARLVAGLDRRPKGRPPAPEVEVHAPPPPPEPAPAEAPPEPSEAPVFLAPERVRLRGAGGSFCETFVPQFRFERSTEGFVVPTRYVTALKNRSLDREHSWCGAGSLRLEADFNLAGPPNEFGSLPNQVGQVMVQLGKPVDLTDKLVVVHFFLDAPTGTQFGVQVMAISKGRWVGGGFEGNVEAGHWWTISHVFQDSNARNAQTALKGGGSPVAEVDALAFQIYATGTQRRWRGNVYIDDVGWR